MLKQNFKIDLKILHGLPASGKSTFAKNFKEESENKNNSLCIIADMDKVFAKSRNEEKDIKEIFKEQYKKKVKYNVPDVLILDGLFLTNDSIAKAIALVMDYYKEERDVEYTFDITIDSWDEDRKNCLRNDILRNREKNSTTTIVNAKFEKANKEKILKLLNENYPEIQPERITSIKKKGHSVYYASDMEIYFANNDVFVGDKDNKIYSEQWCGGGSYGNCWDDTMYTISADTPPKYFEKLVDVIDSLKTSKPISIKDYFDIVDKCVEIEEKYERDYYGGGTTYYRYVADLKDVYNYLDENGFLEDINIDEQERQCH